MVIVVNNKVMLARVLQNSYIFVIETKGRAWLRNKFEIGSIQWSKLWCCQRLWERQWGRFGYHIRKKEAWQSVLRAWLEQSDGWRINHCDNNRSKGSKGSKGAGREGSSCHIDFKVGANCKGLSGLVKLIVYSCWMVSQKKNEGRTYRL